MRGSESGDIQEAIERVSVKGAHMEKTFPMERFRQTHGIFKGPILRLRSAHIRVHEFRDGPYHEHIHRIALHAHVAHHHAADQIMWEMTLKFQNLFAGFRIHLDVGIFHCSEGFP
jgi:hypothetical protein